MPDTGLETLRGEKYAARACRASHDSTSRNCCMVHRAQVCARSSFAVQRPKAESSVFLDRLISPIVGIGQDVRTVPGHLVLVARRAGAAKRDAPCVVLPG